MGWSLGTNDAANAFGTAVATRVIKYRTAIIIIAVLVIVGAFIAGDGNIGKVAELSESNKVTASVTDVENAIANGTLGDLRLKSALKAAIIFACAGITVFVMSYLKFPVSANQSITGAIIGWGLYGARCIEFLFSSKVVKPFMVAYSLVAILGATVDLGLVWSISETCNGLMAIPNLIGVFLLSGTVFKLVKEELKEK